MDDLAELESLLSGLRLKFVDAEGSAAAALSREIRAVRRSIGELSGPEVGSVVDELKREREKRRGAGSARRTSKGRRPNVKS